MLVNKYVCNFIAKKWIINRLDSKGKVVTMRQYAKDCNLATSTITKILTPDGYNIPLTTINNINFWDTSTITNMVNTFVYCYSFNDDISNWDVSNVTDFGGMFDNTSSFNQPIGSWDTSSALSMVNMFFYSSNFNQDIGNWDVSNVTDMNDMFNSSSFNNGGCLYFEKI